MKDKDLIRAEKQEWILDYLKTESPIDILNEVFVDKYVDKFKTKVRIQAYGANKCKDLGKQLSEMYKIGFLKRYAIGTPYGFS